MTKYKTAESVRRGHPDKLCDLIADSILDECLRHDRYSRCACEVMATKGKIFVCGEITCAAKINIRSVVREVLRKAGYNPMKFIVFVYVHRQSSDIAGGVDSALEVRDGGSEDVFATTGAGDQGTVYGYATRETWTRLPVPVVFANDICKDLDEAMRDGTIRGIGPDGKAQVTVVYEDGKPVGVKNIVVSVQHDEGKNLEELRREIISEVLYPIPADYNPRKDLKPGDPEYDKLKRSMEQFGYVEPVIWNKTTGRMVGGHQRLKVLMDMGVTEVECVVVELDEEREKALNIALNKISGDWDKDKLMLLISDLQGADFDVSLTGFDPAEIDDLFKDSLKDGVKDDEFDVDAELENPVITKAGDVWTLGRHRLVCGDSTKAETFSQLMDGLKANLVITDPPYNVNYEGSAGKIKNDNMENAAFYDFLLAAFQNTEEAMADDASIYVFHADTEGLNFRKAFSDAGFYLSGTCIWKKQSLVLGRSPYQWQHEPILFGWKKKGRHQWYTGRKESTIWEFDKPKKNKDHPTMKPVPLLAYPILNSSMSNAIVLDPFGGSGSTLIACEQTDRVCRTIELDEKFCDVIVKRYIEQVGQADGVSLQRDGLTYRYEEVAGDDAEDIPQF